MMTSVTLPSNSGPSSIHGAFDVPESAGVAEEAAIATADAGDDRDDYDGEAPAPTPLALVSLPRPPSSSAKRCLSAFAAADSAKKRRKQATPVRISATDDAPPPSTCEPSPSTAAAPDHHHLLHCPICQLVGFASADALHAHIAAEHTKQEPSYTPPPEDDDEEPPTHQQQLSPKQEQLPWLADLPGKDPSAWMNPNILAFPTAAAAAANQLFMGLPPAAAFAPQDVLPPRQPIRIFNPDAYCELCNKEFCNKYFLKTHKANKHGIYTDPPPPTTSTAPSTSDTPLNLPTYAKMPMEQFAVKPEAYGGGGSGARGYADKLYAKAPKTAVYEAADPSDFVTTSLGGGNSNGHSAGQPDDEASTQQPPQQQPQQADDSYSLHNESTSFTVKQELASASDQELFFTSPSKNSPLPLQTPLQQQQQRELDLSIRYRRIGVMNPKAFCEICCKEYCNKYFLRTHKMKRHGIYIPDEKDGKEPRTAETSSSAAGFVQTSPLNLIMGEQSSNSSTDRNKTSSPSDFSCESCGIKFQNVSLYQLHNVSVHSKLPSNDNSNQSSSAAAERKPLELLTESKSNSADSISEDLQKLQTMILQLNDLDVSKAACAACSTCGKDFENRYYLHAHMMTEHGLLLDDSVDSAEKAAGEEDNTPPANNNTMCDLCGKDFPNCDDMKKHIVEAHNKQTASSVEVKQEFNNGFATPPAEKVRAFTGSGGGERRASTNMTPTSSYCEICNKELCNKYFMKTHMQRMHGIEIENGAQIGGVVCDICNKELCSKYFLRVHKHNTHGIVEYGTSMALQPRKFDVKQEAAPAAQPQPVATEPTDPALKPADLADLSHRYFTHFTEVCMLCSRRFRSTKWLKAHLLSDHGQAGAEKWAEVEQHLQQTKGGGGSSTPGSTKERGGSPATSIKVPAQQLPEAAMQQNMGLQNVLSTIFGGGANTEDSNKTYHCSYCPFSTPILPFLFVHERSHTLQQQQQQQQQQPTISSGDAEQQSSFALKCPVCMQAFGQPEQLQHHIFTQHPFLPLPPPFGFNGFNGDGGSDEDAATTTTTAAVEEDKDIKPLPLPLPKAGKRVVVSRGKRKPMPPDVDEQLRELARKSQLPAAYALPPPPPSAGGSSDEGDASSSAGATPPYVMQAFLVEEAASPAETDAKVVMPSLVYLPVAQKLSAPITATFTLTPA